MFVEGPVFRIKVMRIHKINMGSSCSSVDFFTDFEGKLLMYY